MDRVSTQGYTIYLGENWYHYDDFTRYKHIMHELEHMRQWKRWNVIYSISYLFVLPFGLSMRGYWEWQAFKKSIDAYFVADKFVFNRKSLIDKYTNILTGKAYLFALLFIKPFVRKIVTKYINSRM